MAQIQNDPEVILRAVREFRDLYHVQDQRAQKVNSSAQDLRAVYEGEGSNKYLAAMERLLAMFNECTRDLSVLSDDLGAEAKQLNISNAEIEDDYNQFEAGIAYAT